MIAMQAVPYLTRMLMDRGPLAEINYGDVPVHYNPGLPHGNKGIDWETGIILANFVEAYKPKQIVELGTFRGYSTAWLILGTLLAGVGHVDTFDVFPQGHYGSMWYQEYNLPLTNFHYNEVPGGIWNHPHRIPDEIHFLYHDTEHLPNPTITEMELLLPRILIGGLIVIDDMTHPDYGPMQRILYQYLNSANGWDFRVLHFGHGLGIAKRLR